MRTSSGPIEAASDLAGSESVASRETGGPVRRRLVAGRYFMRHLLEMVVAMLAGMATLGAGIGVLGEPPGYGSPLVEYGLMGVSMSVPMVAWMRYRGHSWWDGLEMTAAMFLPLLALIPLAALGLVQPNDHALMMLSHVAMIAGMVALMAYRWDRYAHGPCDHRA
ncbi:MAG TPA: hypothetical protein VIL85_19015 [Thermomicrobiales bacterium]